MSTQQCTGKGQECAVPLALSLACSLANADLSWESRCQASSWVWGAEMACLEE